MICNLNQLSFRVFGTILSEKERNAALPEYGIRQQLSLNCREAPIYRARAETWLRASSGMTVLSMLCGESYQHFYLDKVVCIRPGVCFSLSAFQGDSTAELIGSEPPEQIGTRQPEDLLLGRCLRVRNIYTFFYQEKERGFFFPGESHSMLELTYVDQGVLHSVADGQELLLQQGELVIYGPHQWHMQYADMDVGTSFVTITFDLEGDNWQSLPGKKFTLSRQSAGILRQLLWEKEHTREYYTDMILCQLTMLLLTLLRSSDTPEEKLKSANAAHAENEIIRRTQQYIGEHVMEKLSVPLVAQMVDVSPSYLTALFHRNLQISPGEYIRRVKLQQSKQMIREGNMNFTQIAEALQYSTVHHFSRQFKEKFGITPSEYAKSVR